MVVETTPKMEISWHAVYYHFRKWSRDGSLERVWQGSIMTISADLNLSELNLDGSHALVKKGGESVAHQGPRKVKHRSSYQLQIATGSSLLRQV